MSEPTRAQRRRRHLASTRRLIRDLRRLPPSTAALEHAARKVKRLGGSYGAVEDIADVIRALKVEP